MKEVKHTKLFGLRKIYVPLSNFRFDKLLHKEDILNMFIVKYAFIF